MQESEVVIKSKRAKEVSYILSNLSTYQKNIALQKIKEALIEMTTEIIKVNDKDIEEAKKQKLSEALIDRLRLTKKRIEDIALSIDEVIALKDPIGEVVAGWKRPNNLFITKVRVPLGVVGIIYEARPNVTVDAACLCLKSSNAVILRGGKEAINSNIFLVNIMREAINSVEIPQDAIQIIEQVDRKYAVELMQQVGLVDVLIPRGGASLIKEVINVAKVPVIETGVGNCHIFVDKTVNLDKALKIIINAKCQRPSVCNAVETVLIHEDIAKEFIPKLFKELKDRKVELRGCEKVLKIDNTVKQAQEQDWYTEYLDLILAVKIVEDVDEAIEHINKYSSHHTEAILTEDITTATKFKDSIDSSTIFINASTRFTDGYEFGLGAEIGISTQKLHARGPMALEALTSTKFIVYGDGQIRE